MSLHNAIALNNQTDSMVELSNSTIEQMTVPQLRNSKWQESAD
ncbi:hypothetical protein [Kovacikia minuta]|nr:hypothetical protein [Kovacikia minuta]